MKKTNLRNLKRIIDGWDARLRLQQSVAWLPRGLIGGLIITLLVAGAARVWPLIRHESVLMLSLILPAIGLVTALLMIWLWRRTTLQAARLFDREFGLHEHMSAAVELSLDRLPVESPELANRQYQQAMAAAGRVEVRKELPLRSDWREWAGVGIAIGLVAIAVLLPNPQEEILAQQAAVEEAIAEELEELERIREQVLEDPALTVEEQEAVVEVLDDAIETLEQQGVTQEEALAALESAEEELRDLSEEFADERQQALEEASSAFDGTAAEDLANALEQGDMDAAAEALENLDLDSLSPEEQQALAEALGEAAEALEGSNPELAESFGNAAEALENGDTAGAEAELDDAAGELGEQGEGQSTAEVDEYADEVGKGQGGVAGAGKGPNQGNQPGQGGMGQVQPQPGGDGQQGGGGSGSGRGEGDGEAQGGQAGDQMPTDNGPGDGGQVEYGGVYAPQRIGGEGGDDVDIPGDPGAGLPTGVEGDFTENPSGDASVPYGDVYGDYEGAVNEALESGHVPLNLRDLIRLYFSNLDPGSE